MITIFRRIDCSFYHHHEGLGRCLCPSSMSYHHHIIITNTTIIMVRSWLWSRSSSQPHSSSSCWKKLWRRSGCCLGRGSTSMQSHLFRCIFIHILSIFIISSSLVHDASSSSHHHIFVISSSLPFYLFIFASVFAKSNFTIFA